MSEVGWLVIAAAIVVVVSAVGCHSYRRRRELVLTAAHLEFAVVDSLAGRQFTPFCAALLRVLGYRKVRRFRRQRGKAGDLIGQAPDGTLVVIGCARQRDPVEGDAVTALRAAVTSGRHAGRTAILVTTALVTPDARALAADGAGGSPVTVADRAVLRHWMEQARAKIVSPGPGPRGLAGMRRDTRALAGIVACATVAVLAVGVQAAIGGAAAGSADAVAARGTGPAGPLPSAAPAGTAAASPAPASGGSAGPARVSRAAVSPPAVSPRAVSPAPAGPTAPARPGGAASPQQVVRAFYAAISRHDWPRVWRLGGRNLGYGPYATYQGMVAGYAGTVRDEVTDLRARGTVVTGHFRAYHADGGVRAYRFSYVVRGGAITSGFQLDMTGLRCGPRRGAGRVTVRARPGRPTCRSPRHTSCRTTRRRRRR